MPAIDTCVMKKVVIPTILAATILVAGMFAMMPVQKAATIHSTGAGNQILELTDADHDAGDVYTIDCTSAAQLLAVNIFTAGTLSDEDVTLAVGGEAAAAAVALPAGNTAVWNNNVGIGAAETATITGNAQTDNNDESVVVKVSLSGGGTCTLV
jgi:hypothetical protein